MKHLCKKILLPVVILLTIAFSVLLTAFAEETYVAENKSTGTRYTSLAAALDEAASGQTVMIIEDATLSTDAVVKSGVTLLVPYKNGTAATEDGTSDHARIFADRTATYKQLTVSEGATLTVNGTLNVGGIIGFPGQYYQGHTSGAHGRIVNDGTIVIAGTMNTYGFVEGEGTVSVVSGGKVYEPFVVFDFAGGSNTQSLYNAGQPPFTQYTMQNISCGLSIAYGGRLYGRCNLYAGSAYNKTDQLMVGTSSDTALIKMSSGTVTRTVDKSLAISGATATDTPNYGADIGRVTYVLDGGAAFGSMSLKIRASFFSTTINVNKLTVPYCLEYVLENGTYSTSNTFYVLPGGAVKIGEGASFSLNGTMYVFDGLRQSGMSGRFYPSTEKLAAAGFATNGVLTVDGTFNILANATFGGIAQSTKAGGSIAVNARAIVNKTNLAFGGSATYDDNSVTLDLPGRVLFHNVVTNMTAGTTYDSYTGREWILEGYDIKKYTTSNGADEKTYAENVHVTTNQPMSGEWSYAGHEVTVHPARETTCTEIGWDEDYTCEADDYNTYTEIPALGHDYES